ncbi:TolC family protein [Marinifilum sp. RC60d5]|uniref:TolC family protein n=1 Tax=Marinifilum sp. RC60d5 TaxID=3458414 RepID=UPI004035BCB5
MNNIIVKISMALFLGLLMIPKINAQEVLTLHDCKQKAMDHNQTVKSALSDLESSEASLTLSKRSMLPAFDISSSYTYLSDPNQMIVPGFELPTVDGLPSGVYSPASISDLAYENSYSASLGMSLPIYMGGKLRHANKLSSLSLSMAEDNVDLSKSDLLLDVETKYWNVVSLQEQKGVVEKSIALLTDVLKEVRNRYETGVVTKNEVLKTQVELNNSKLSLIEVSNNLELAKMSLNQSIGNGITSKINIQDSIINIPEQLAAISYSENHLDSRPEIKMLNNQVEMSKVEKKITNADYLPQIVSYANYVSQNPNRYAQQENEFTFNAGVTMSIPVFHWGEKKLKKVQNKIAIQKAELDLEESSELIILEIRQAIFRLKEALVKLDFTTTSLEQANENLKLETNRLMEGVTTTRDLLDAQLQWQQSRASYINAKTEVKTNEAKYYKSIGDLRL